MRHRYRKFTTLMICALFPFGIIMYTILLVFGLHIEHALILAQTTCIVLTILIMRRGVVVDEEHDEW